MTNRIMMVLFALVCQPQIIVAQKDTAKAFQNTDPMGGPKSIGRQLEEENNAITFQYRYNGEVLKPYYDFKKSLNDKYGLQFNAFYTSAYIYSTKTIDEDRQAGVGSGILDLQLGWNLVGRKTGKNRGTLFIKANSRHTYAGPDGPVPMFHGLTESGYYGLPATGFNDYTFRILELNWQQNFFNERLGIVLGKVDLTNYFNFHGLIIPWRHFMGFGSSVSGSMNWGNQGFGAVASYRLTDHWYVMAGIVDVYGDQFQDGDFLDLGEYWQDGLFQFNGEVGWVPSYEERYFKKISLTYYTSPEYTAVQNGAVISRGQGVAFSAHWFFQERYVPFVRFGFSNGVGENNFYSADVQVGHGWRFRYHDILGIAASWNQPNIPDVDDQFTAEVFYRINISARLEITPSTQFIINPTLNPTERSLLYFAIRGRARL
ncbi:hypothetical protein HZ996_08100 [Cryomorphaceae bacterium]|nr:hypothetical protein HZ996_08100 [Cryomorphaceae bacterium]